MSAASFVLLLTSVLWMIDLGPQNPQTPPPTPLAPQSSEAQTKIRVNSELVVLPVTVKDRFGELAADLQQDDFRIFDNGAEQSIDVFTAEAFPLSLVILLDDDLKSKDAAAVTPSLRAITGGISASDEAIVCRFDLDFYPGEAFTSDLDKLWSDLKNAQERTKPSEAPPTPWVISPSAHPAGVGEPKGPAGPIHMGSRPTKALDDALHAAADLLHDRGASRRKAILLVTDGINGAQFNRYNYSDTVEALLRDNVSVYSLAVGSAGLFQKRFARLLHYSTDTGGDIYYASTTSSMEHLYSRITEQARHEYTLAYVPRNVSAAPYHKIEVRVNRPAVTVATRQGYYTAQPVSIP